MLPNNFTLHLIEDYPTWNQVFSQLDTSSFFQTWEWGEQQQATGYQVLRLAVKSPQEEVIGLAQVVKIRSKKGDFIFIPHGPLAAEGKYPQVLESIVSYLKPIADSEGFAFIRISPLLTDSPEHRNYYQSLGFKRAPLYVHSEHVWVLPLEKSEEELLSAMRKTTRYSIKKSAKDGGVIEKRTDEQAVDEFWQVYQQTAARENFTPFRKKYILDEFKAFNKTGKAVFFVGKANNQPEVLASALIVFTPTTAFYHQGASVHSKIPITYQLQWEAIREAKSRGCLEYNFQGIAEDENPHHPWAGLTLFKKGFDGYQIDYVPAQDIVLSPKYYLTYLIERFIKWRRRF
jgi:peptidoglycan pentaglycine glycine transferase (the first glycine)